MATMMASLPPHSAAEDAWMYPDVSCAPVTTAGYYYTPLTATTSSSSDTSSVCSTGFVDWTYLEPWTDSNLLNQAVSPAAQYSPIPPAHEQLSPHYSPQPSHHHLSVSPQLHSVNSDPPRFYTCNYPNCTAAPNDRIFTRKSDWRRHTDKHTRPYRCTHASCADLPGFSWPGGLNRHLEEQHTAAAQRHRCPYRDCKRHEKGFNRCWNLKNHIKKVHSKKRKEVVIEELKRVEREVGVREREEVEARRRREMAMGRLNELRGELVTRP